MGNVEDEVLLGESTLAKLREQESESAVTSTISEEVIEDVDSEDEFVEVIETVVVEEADSDETEDA